MLPYIPQLRTFRGLLPCTRQGHLGKVLASTTLPSAEHPRSAGPAVRGHTSKQPATTAWQGTDREAAAGRQGLRTSRMSLSMDLGTPTTEQRTPLASQARWMALAAALPPLPPTTNSMLTPQRLMRRTISSMSAPPRDVPCSSEPA